METHKQFYQKWWFWVLAVFVLLFIISGFNNSSDSSSKSIETKPSSTSNEGNSEIVVPSSQETWHPVINFTGSSGKKTDTFNIRGDKFRLTYTVLPENDYSLFYLYVYEPGNSIFKESFSLESGSETSISYEGAGEYYLDITSANLRKWTVLVEDYY